jgi:serine/threonine protein kinase
LGDINHKNICRFEGKFEDEEFIYLIFEFCKCQNLRKFLTKHSILSLELIKFWSAEILNALIYLDSKEIVHRDLKPENILIDENFHVKLCDFGAAKYYNRDEVDREYTVESESEDSDLESSESSMFNSNKLVAGPPLSLATSKTLVRFVLVILFSTQK